MDKIMFYRGCLCFNSGEINAKYR